MEVREIVKKWLEENGYDGLYDEEFECGCFLSDLMPCDETVTHCKAGYRCRIYYERGYVYGVGPRKEKDQENENE